MSRILRPAVLCFARFMGDAHNSTGNPISPVIKIASNSVTTHSFSEYIDFDTGSIIDGSESVESLGEKLLDEVIAYASGIKKTKADLQGRDDFLPWKRGMSV